MAGEDEVLIKIAADVAQAVTAIQSVGTTIDASLGGINESATATNAIVQTLTQTLTAGFEGLSGILGAISQNVGETNLGIQTVVGVFTGMAEAASNVAEKTKDAGDGIEEVGEKAKRSTEDAVTWGTLVAQAINQITHSAGEAVKAFPMLVAGQAAAGEQLNILANRLDLTAEATRELQFVSDVSGVNMNVMARATQNLSAQLQDADSKASKAVKSIGLFPEELNKLSKTEAMAKIVEQIKQLPPGLDKGAKMIEIFGSKAQMMTGLLKEDLPKLHDEFANLVDEKAIQDSARLGNEYGGAMTKIELTIEEFKRGLSNAVLPVVNQVLDALPGLGGAALLAGQSLFKVGESMAPMVSNFALAQIQQKGFTAAMADFSGTLGKLGPLMADFGGQLLKMGKFLLTNPWGLLITAGAILLPMLWDMVGGWEGISKAIKPVITYFEDMYTIGKDLAEMFLGDLVTGLGELVTWFKELFSSTDKGMSALQGLIDWAAEWISWLEQFPIVGQYIKIIKLEFELLFAAAQKLWEWVQKAGSGIAGFFQRVGKEAHDTAEGIRALDAATAAATNKLADQKKAQDALAAGNKEQVKTIGGMAEKVDYLNSAYASLSTTEKQLIKDGLAAGMSTQKVAEELQKTLYHGITTVETAETIVKRFTDSIKKAETEAKKNPFLKLQADAKELAAGLAMAAKAGATTAEVVAKFGKHAAGLLEDSKLIPGAFAALDPAVRRVAQAFDDAAFQKILDKFYEKTGDVADLWKNVLPDAVGQFDAAMMASLQRATAMQAQLTRNAMTGAQQRMAAIDDEEKNAIAAVNNRLIVGTAAHKAELDLIHKIADDKRAVEAKYTGDVLRDMEMRGIKSQEQLEKEADTERKVLANMLAAREANSTAVSAVQIAAQEKIVANSEAAAGKVTTDWSGALSTMAGAFANLAQISGSTFGGVMKGMGQVIGQADVMQKGISSAMGEKGIGGIGKAFSASKDGASGFGGLLKGIGGSIPMIGTAIQGVMAAATMAIDMGKKMWDAFTKSPGEKLAKRVEKDFKDASGKALKVSEEFGNKLAVSMKSMFKGDMFAAEIYHLNDIIKEAGGISEKNFESMSGRMRDIFVLVEQGKFSTEQATKVLNENFSAFADHVVKSGTIANKQFTDLIGLNEEFGTKSKAVMDFVGQQTGRLGTALGTLAGTMTANADSVARFETIAVGGFNAALAAGVPYLDAVNQLSPALDAIVAKHTEMGTTGGAAIQELLRFREVTVANKELVEGTGALNEVMLALSNIGGLNVETFTALQQQGNETFAQLTAAGFTEQQSLQQMQGYLENVEKAHKELGLPIDENTEKLLDQAHASGVLRKEEMKTNDIMIQGLSAIIEAVGGKVPAAFKTMSNAAVTTAKTVDKALDNSTTMVDGMATAVEEVPFDAFADEAVNAAIVAERKMQVAQAAVAEVGVELAATPFNEFANEAQKAADLAQQEFYRAADAVFDVGTQLNNTDWAGWQSEAVNAANKVADAVNEVSFGASPGGIKEIPIQLDKAARSATDFARSVSRDMAKVKADIERVSAPDMRAINARDTGPETERLRAAAINARDTGPETERLRAAAMAAAMARDTGPETERLRAAALEAIQSTRDTGRETERLRAATLAAEERAEKAASRSGDGGGDTLHFTFEIKAFDSHDMARTVENEIMPKILDSLRRGRNLSTLRDLVRE